MRLHVLPAPHPHVCLRQTPGAAATSHQDTPISSSTSKSSGRTSHLDGVQQPQSEIVSGSLVSWRSRLDWELLLLVSALPVPAAVAEEGLKYDSSRGEGIVKTLSGALYIGLLLYFLFRVLNRRARKAREEVRGVRG